MRTPSGKLLERPEFRASMPGHYFVLDDRGQPVFCFAVNMPAEESDPASVMPEEIIAALQHSAGQEQPKSHERPGSGTLGLDQGDTAWWYIILLAILVLTAELAISNRAVRH